MRHNIDQQGTPVDRATGEKVTMMTHNNELEGESNKMELRHSYKNVRDENLLKEGHFTASPSTNTNHPKKLNTDCNDSVLSTPNRSNTSIRNPSK